MLDLKRKHLGGMGRAVFFGAAMGLVTLAGCKKADGTQTADNTGPDPADVNQAPVSGSQQVASPAQAGQPARTTRVLAQSQAYQGQQAESYPQAAPIERAPNPQNYRPPYTPQQQDQGTAAYQQGDENFDQTIDQYAEQAPEPPPPLPVYAQPPCPEPNYLWTPGYWSYAPAGYFWVPGAWAAPPYEGALWTPGYWGGYGNGYRFHRGFWGLHIGFYGGISYGFGYTGSGYHGGYWNGNNFYYNRAVNRVNETNIHNTYVRNVTVNNTVNNRISYNGGRGGVQARPAAYEVAAMREQHTPPMAAQVQLREQSQQNRQQFYSANQGRPTAVVATRPLGADRGIAAPSRQAFSQTPAGARPSAGVTGGDAQRGFQAKQPEGQLQRNELQQRNQQQEQPKGFQQREQPQTQQFEQQQREQQQRNEQQVPQRNEQQRNQQQVPQPSPQQRNDQQLQQQRSDQQRNQQLQLQQQRNDAQRNQQLQQQQQNQQQLRGEQERGQQRMQPHPQPNEQRPQPQTVQPRVEPQRPAAQPQAQPQPRPEAARPASAPRGEGERRPPL